jgi:hypothetical protein
VRPYERVLIHDRIRDLHATILHCLGLDHVGLTYLYNGRFQRLTGTAGELISKALA